MFSFHNTTSFFQDHQIQSYHSKTYSFHNHPFYSQNRYRTISFQMLLECWNYIHVCTISLQTKFITSSLSTFFLLGRSFVLFPDNVLLDRIVYIITTMEWLYYVFTFSCSKLCFRRSCSSSLGCLLVKRIYFQKRNFVNENLLEAHFHLLCFGFHLLNPWLCLILLCRSKLVSYIKTFTDKVWLFQ